MAKFQNKTGMDVYIDLGKLILVKSDEVIELEGSYSCPPLTVIHPESKAPTKKKPAKKVPPKPKSKSPSGTI
tara:strand:+ start:1640 stop:1855 length:216 start_codon:yes stop_codon:yes gene_type:complete